jgi:hypothetical protein
VTENSPQLTIKPPQIHHQKTTLNTPFFQKLPAKTPKQLHNKKREKPSQDDSSADPSA